MPSEKGSKPRSPKGFGPLACAVLVISAKRKHTYSTLGLLRPSIWFASSPGLMVTCQLQHGYQPMKGCTLPLRGFTSSVKSVPDPFRGWNFDKSVGERIYWEG